DRYTPVPTKLVKTGICSAPPVPAAYTSIKQRPTSKSTKESPTGSTFTSNHLTPTSKLRLVTTHSVQKSECSRPPIPSTHATEPRPTLNNSSRTVSGTTAYKASPIRTRSVPTSECSQPPGPPTYSTTSTANTEKSTHVKATVVPTHSARQSECSQPPAPP
ncbi:hypothetical protein K493DRAFT_146001, partial [Basidiobolus meristosporus CBS 931.73]